MELDKPNKKPASQASLKARDALQSLEDTILAPIFNGIKHRFLAICNPIADYIDQADAPDTYKIILQEFYPSFPNWHEDPQSKSKESFNPHNSREGRVADVYFLEKYQTKAPKLFKELMQIRIEYFEKIKN